MNGGEAIAVTGAGIVGPAGLGNDALARALEAGARLGTPIGRTVAHRRGAAADAALVRPETIAAMRDWLDPKSARRMSLPSRFAVAAAKLALADAGLAGADLAGAAVGLATIYGSAAFTERILEEICTTGPELVSPFLFTDCVANAAAGQVAIACGATGANATPVAREAGALAALDWCARELRLRRSPRALAGSADEMPPLTHAILDRLGAIARGAGARARPFDARRSGRFAGEGAAVAVLEPLAAARGRGARIAALLRATAAAFDPTAPAHGFGSEPERTAAALLQALAAQDVAPDGIDAIVSGAGGTVAGDEYELRLLRVMFGAALPPVVAPRHVIGDFGAGILPVALHLLRGGACRRDEAFAPDPRLGLRPHDGALPQARRLLLTGVASGGAVVLAVLEAAS